MKPIVNVSSPEPNIDQKSCDEGELGCHAELLNPISSLAVGKFHPTSAT